MEKYFIATTVTGGLFAAAVFHCGRIGHCLFATAVTAVPFRPQPYSPRPCAAMTAAAGQAATGQAAAGLAATRTSRRAGRRWIGPQP
ncbi:hypothetical protein GNQ08_16585 [Paenibacillus macerans]|uniref:Uncharacterized protein n=1 Tax=Paenibacillus macerans TaxID=44252 RepID=A0A6N8F053_PAEMA|nr:hypothetical protein [Paenibacillus macerans]MBS5912642.1 hypothetical protein [Paenibacillus macerans]MUG24008.1 hypothetical protein [Paenibacillus macerans]UMV45392.1 hypothetical protein LMZ02_17860 [Paenibacillus macerans]